MQDITSNINAALHGLGEAGIGSASYIRYDIARN